ncbi:MAG: carboxypeptidase-like regulatory domain-containing protein [bacterium]
MITGTVVDEKGTPIPYVNVFFKNSFDGDVSDSTGHFEILTKKTGLQTLIASLIGYERFTRELQLSSSKVGPVKIILRKQAILMPEAIVTASSFTSGDEQGVRLKTLEVVTTPGAAADIFRAIKTFPGLAQVDEGSGLFVRGGDVSETVTILDQATIVHPYRFESPTGGIFGTITPFLVRGTFFSTGGFSAKYGNALSGILAMESLGRPLKAKYNFNIGLAATSVQIALPLKNKSLGVRFSGNRSSTGLMFRVNGRHADFTKHPRGTDVNFSLNYDYSTTGHLKFFAFAAENQVGAKVNQPSFDGIFNSDDLNQLYNLQWTELISRNWFIQASVSLNDYRTQRSLGVLDFRQKDQAYKFRLDSEKQFGSDFHLNFGMEGEWTRNRFVGRFPESEVLDPNADAISIDARYDAIRTGGYLEGGVKLSQRVFTKAGLRADAHNLSAQTVFDPRVSFYYQISDRSHVRSSWGIYHQFPSPFHYAPGYGNPELIAQRAIHYVLGYEYQVHNTQARVEIYYKDYDNLVLEHDVLGFTNRGHGYARGVDIFFKHGVLFQNKLNGWISYSFLQSRRLQTRNLVNGEMEEFAPSPFDITHNFTLVAKYSPSSRLTAGLSYRYATGRPITPIVDAKRHPQFDFYLPIEGAVGSERLPSYQRLDANLSYYLPLRGNNHAVFYLAVSNLLNRQNVLDYDYSFDYRQRTPRTTNYSRFIYFGVAVNFQ